MISVTSRRLFRRTYRRVRFIGISKPTRSNERNWWDKIIYSKTYEVGHTCKSATCHSWPHFYGTSKFLWNYTWSLVRNLATCISWILATVARFVLCCLCKFILPVMAYLKSCRVFGRNSSFIIRTALCLLSLRPLLTSLDNTLEFSTGNWTITWLKGSLFINRVIYLLANWTTWLSTLKCRFAHVIVARFKFHSGFPSWVALGVSKGGQHRFRCTCI